MLFVEQVILLFACDSGNAGKGLTLDSLKQSATASGYIRYLVSHAKLIDAGYSVTTTDKGISSVFSGFYYSVAECTATCSEVVHFKYSGRAIPQDCLTLLDDSCEFFAALRADIQTFPSVGDSLGRSDLSVSIVRECICDNRIFSQYNDIKKHQSYVKHRKPMIEPTVFYVVRL